MLIGTAWRHFLAFKSDPGLESGLRNNILGVLYYNILQYIVTNTIYCSVKSIAIYCIGVLKYCNILYCSIKVLQYIVLSIWSIAIYCIAELKYCNILYCIFKMRQYNNNTIVRSPAMTSSVDVIHFCYSCCYTDSDIATDWTCCLHDISNCNKHNHMMSSEKQANITW